MEETKKAIRVVAAIITKNGRYFATQRGYGEWRGYWEFPGGKIEVGETPQEALRREIEEELGAEIGVDGKLCTVEYDYPAFHLSMDCFFAKVKNGKLTLKEHDAAKWLSYEELDSVDWLPADEVVIGELKNE